MVVARYEFQAEAARKLGANHVIQGTRNASYYSEVVEFTGAEMKKPMMGKPLVMGGVDRVFDCVGSNTSLDDAMRLTKNGGQVVFVGEPGMVKNLDWTPIFTQDLEVKAAYLYHHTEEFRGQRWKTFDLAIHLMANESIDLSWLITQKFLLSEYKQAFSAPEQKKEHEAIKIAFEFPE